MGAPLDLPHGELMAHELRLARAADRGVLRSLGAQLHHAAVPHLDRLVDARAREHERPVLIPVEREHLRAGRGHGERCRREGCGEGVGGWPGGRVGGRAEVEDLERAVRGAGRDHVRLVWREGGLVHAGWVRVDGRY